MKTYSDLLSMINNLPNKEDQVTKYIEYLETQEEENFKKLNELEEHFKDIHKVLEGVLDKTFLTTDEIEIIEDLAEPSAVSTKELREQAYMTYKMISLVP